MGWTPSIHLLENIPGQQWHQIVLSSFCLDKIQQKDACLYLNNGNRYYGNNEGKIVLEDLHKFWKHHAQNTSKKCIKEMSTWANKLVRITQIWNMAQPVMVKNHARHTFEPKYLLDYRVLKIHNDSTLLLVTAEWEGKEKELLMMSNLESTSELIENVWDSFLGSIKK